MNKYQAIHQFWSSFGWPAYNEMSVPDEKTLPYITYEAASSDFDRPVAQTAQLHDRAKGWTNLYAKAKEIEDRITRGGTTVYYDDTAFHIQKESPWVQEGRESSDPDALILYLNYSVEFYE